MNKRGNEQSEITPSSVINHPKVFSEVRLNTVPIGIKDKGTKIKKTKETASCK